MFSIALLLYLDAPWYLWVVYICSVVIKLLAAINEKKSK